MASLIDGQGGTTIVAGSNLVLNGNVMSLDSNITVRNINLDTINNQIFSPGANTYPIAGSGLYYPNTSTLALSPNVNFSTINGQVPVFGGSSGIQSLTGQNGITILNQSTIALSPNVNFSTINGQAVAQNLTGGSNISVINNAINLNNNVSLNYNGTFISTTSNLVVSSNVIGYTPRSTSVGSAWFQTGKTYFFKTSVSGTYQYIISAQSGFITHNTFSQNQYIPFSIQGDDIAITCQYLSNNTWTILWRLAVFNGLISFNEGNPQIFEGQYDYTSSIVSTNVEIPFIQATFLTPSTIHVSTLNTSTLTTLKINSVADMIITANAGISFGSSQVLMSNLNISTINNQIPVFGGGGSSGIQTLVAGNQIDIFNASTIAVKSDVNLSSLTLNGTTGASNYTSSFTQYMVLQNYTTGPAWFNENEVYAINNPYNTNTSLQIFINYSPITQNVSLVPNQLLYFSTNQTAQDTLYTIQANGGEVALGSNTFSGTIYSQIVATEFFTYPLAFYKNTVVSTIVSAPLVSLFTPSSVSTQQLYVSSINGQVPVFGGSSGIQSLTGQNGITILNQSTIALSPDVNFSTINGASYPPPGTSVVSTFQTVGLTPSTLLQSATGFSELQVYNPTSLSTCQVAGSGFRVIGNSNDTTGGVYTRDTSNRAVFVGSNATVNRLAYTNDPTLVVSTLTASQFVSTQEFYVSTLINNNFVNNTTTTNDAFFSTIKFRNGAGIAQISQPSTIGANSQPAGRFLFNQDIDVGTNDIWGRRIRIGIQNPPATTANELIFYDSIGGRQIGLQTANNDRTLRINDSITPGFAAPGYLLDTRLNPVLISSISGNPITNTALQCLFPSTTQNTIGISTLSLFPAPLPLTQFGSATFSSAPSTFTLSRPYRDTSYVVQLTPQADTSGQVAHATILSPSTFAAHAGSGSSGTGFFWTTIGNNY